MNDLVLDKLLFFLKHDNLKLNDGIYGYDDGGYFIIQNGKKTRHSTEVIVQKVKEHYKSDNINDKFLEMVEAWGEDSDINRNKEDEKMADKLLSEFKEE